MKNIFIVCISGLLIGCSHNEKQTYFPPSSIPVTQSVSKATSKVAAITPFVKPEGKAALKELEDSLFETQVHLGKYVMQVDDQSRELAKVQNEVVYWHTKQIAALKELWVWRLIALFAVACVALYVGIKTSWKFLI